MTVWRYGNLVNGLKAALALLLLAFPVGLLSAGEGGTPSGARFGFTLLGTNSGAIPDPERMQPANVLRVGDRAILIDAGDGAAAQLAKAGISLRQVDTILISHLHFDHIGGLFALMSQRFQMQQKSPLKIYGPTGTSRFVTALCATMDGASQSTDLASYGSAACANVSATDMTARDALSIHGIEITAAENTHYATSGKQASMRSLSFRFRTAAGSLVYTGDTGPSVAVERLARDADILVSEIVDPDLELAEIRSSSPGLPAALLSRIDAHLRGNHLSPREVGLLAERSRVKSLVLTHISFQRDQRADVLRQVSQGYRGPIIVADDLDSF